jgi:hypothetical protein
MKGYIPDIIEEVKSGIIHIVHVVDRVDEKDEKYRERVSSGTGFMVNGYLVTNYHVINIEGSDKNSYIVLRTHDINPPIETEKTIYLYKELEGIKVYRNEGGFFTTETGNDTDDYCVLDIPELREKSNTGELYNFLLDSHAHKKVGEEILFIGYHFDDYHIISHRGFISSLYTSRTYEIKDNKEYEKVNKIQIDASVNSGNSGSPLIDPNTSRVIGIITRKEDGLTKNFSNFDENIQTLKNELKTSQENIDSCKAQISSNAGIKIFNESRKMREIGAGSTINLNDAAIIMEEEGITLEITKHLSNSITRLLEVSSKLSDISKEMKRSANVGIGYAYSVENLMNENFYIQG